MTITKDFKQKPSLHLVLSLLGLVPLLHLSPKVATSPILVKVAMIMIALHPDPQVVVIIITIVLPTGPPNIIMIVIALHTSRLVSIATLIVILHADLQVETSLLPNRKKVPRQSRPSVSTRKGTMTLMTKLKARATDLHGIKAGEAGAREERG